jgi:hypothetical protein
VQGLGAFVIGAADEIERTFVGVIVVDVIDGALFFKIVRESDFLDGDAFGFLVGGIWLELGGCAEGVGGVRREEAWEEPGHAAAEGRDAGAQDAHVQLDVAPEGRERALVGHVLGDGDWVDPDQAEDGDDTGADMC